MAPWEAGTQLGPYELISPVGAGGMGEVWKARDTRLNRIVAVKRLKAQHNQRFEQEARAIAALNHPHICQLYDVGPDHLVLEYIDGSALRGPLAVEEAVRLAIQIASALEEAHSRGILHRDLKPGNIMVTGKGTAKLLDFGLAKLVTDGDSDVTRTIEGMVVGTAAYMAPEQAQGKPLDERSDVFSFGAVLYEILSGNRAFGGNSTAQVLSAVLRDDPQPLQAPAALSSVVKRCLAKQPEHRFQSITEVRAVLEEFSATPAEQQPSIAVLPFANMSADKDNEYFSDGLAEEIINALAQIPGLKVTARTSAFAFRGKEQDITKIAELLHVRTILEGSVRRAGNRLRVTAQLINASDGYHLWSERFDREMTDVFAIQDEIAQAIAGALQVKLSAEPATLRRYTPKLPAYEAYLKGLHCLSTVAPDKLEQGKQWLEQAIALDPMFALAHSSLGLYFLRLALAALLPAHEAMPQVRRAARAALSIDPTLPEAHALLGVVAAVYDYDWNEADRLFRLAMSRNPVPPLVRSFAMLYLLPAGRLEDATNEQRRALKDDPLNMVARFQLASCLLIDGMDAQAEPEFRQTLGLDENFWLAAYGLGVYYAQKGMLNEAMGFAERAYSLAPWSTNAIGLLAAVLLRSGDRIRAQDLLKKLGDGPVHSAPGGFSVYHLLCSEIDRAAEWAEKAIEQRDPRIAFLYCYFEKTWKSSPRWPALAKMMNLPTG